MHPDTHMLAELLSLAALMAATIDYGEVTKRRALRRVQVAVEDEGLRGLVRVFLADAPRTRQAD
jgi:hypothetical protein